MTIKAAAMKDLPKMIAMQAPVKVTAEQTEGEATTPARFDVVAYNGGMLNIYGWGKPIVIDLEGLEFSKNVVANLDHVESQRVGHVTDKTKTVNQVMLGGLFSYASTYRDEVVNSSKGGFEWEASVEVCPTQVLDVEDGDEFEANGQTFKGPAYCTRKGILDGFAFVSHGADADTEVKIAAKAASRKEQSTMNEELKAWLAKTLPSVDAEKLTPEEVANLQADFDGRGGKRQNAGATNVNTNPFEKQKAEASRRRQLREIADRFVATRECADRGDLSEIDNIEKMLAHATETGMTPQDFRIEMYEATVSEAQTVRAPRNTETGLTERVIEAAICTHGRLPGLDKKFKDQELQAAHDRFRNGIGLKELVVIAAEANGYRQHGYTITQELHNAAFGMTGNRSPIRAAASFSTFSLQNILRNIANLFLRTGWMSVDQTLLRIASIRPVNDFKEIKTVSLTGGMMFQPVGQDGELKHGQVGEVVFSNKADTYGILFSITRTDYINDDLNALTAVPRRIGRGGMLKLNDIGWKEFLDNATFFSTGNLNVSTDDGTMSIAGLSEAEIVFSSQLDPDGNPIGIEPAILLVPTAQKTSANTLMMAETITGLANSTQPNANPFRGRFKVESSPYMHFAKYTGSSSLAWYMMADPDDVPVLEIAALNGRIDPHVETADADFNVLGVQMRGYSDVGVRKQDPRGAVRADGSPAD